MFNQEATQYHEPAKVKWDIEPAYCLQRELGCGSYGAVCEAIKIGTNTRVAIKKYSGIFNDRVLCRRVLREVELLYSLNHPYIVKPIEIFPRNGFNDLYLVMELANADLRRLSKGGISLDHRQVQIIMYSILTALNYLHSGGIVHRDIKPGNILVNSDCTVWLCDFSISRSMTGLISSTFDYDQVLRQNPYLGSSASSFCSFSDSSSLGLTPTVPPKAKNEEDDITEEGPTAQMTVYCDFEVKFKKKKLEQTPSKSDIDSPSKKEEPKKKPMPTEEEKLKRLEEKKKEQREILLGKCKEATKNLERELTGHIGTRWYRAPELVLLEKVYTSAVDMWAVGCVFAELLGMLVENQENPSAREPLFQGSSCFPVSPSLKPTAYIAGLPVSPRDQANTILEVLGNPKETDTRFLSDKKAEEYINGFPKHMKKPFSSLYKYADPNALDLLEKLLTFNPYYRITAKEAIRHKYFEDIRDKALEIEFVQPVELTSDKYSYAEFDKVARPILLNLIGFK